MKQYWDLKGQAGDALLLFRMGDFYELFGDDAVIASRILEITLTSRDKNSPNPMPMAGVPHHSVSGYLQKLLDAGKKVAIGEQLEGATDAASSGKGIVKREITRLFTPAIQFETQGAEANYLATAVETQENPRGTAGHWILSYLDPATGEILLGSPMPIDAVISELQQRPPRHWITTAPNALSAVAQTAAPSMLYEELPSNYLGETQARELIQKQFGHWESEFTHPKALLAVATLITYASRALQIQNLTHLRRPAPLRRSTSLRFGPRTPKHLQLFPDAEGESNVFDLINKTQTSLGSRALRSALAQPWTDTGVIASRQNAVRALNRGSLKSNLRSELAKIYDLDRILGRVTARLANPRDTLALGKSIDAIGKIHSLLAAESTNGDLKRIGQSISDAHAALSALGARILKDQRDDAPLSTKDGGIFNDGTTPELDRLLTLTRDGEKWLIDLEAREREATGITSLKVRYNRVFGYYIEITKANLKNVPDHYQRKQSMVSAERFFTEELKKFEEEILTATTRQKAMEQRLFEELIESILRQSEPIVTAAHAIGELDLLTAFATLAERPGWVFPEINDSLEFDVRSGRHPLVDESARGAFIPNDLRLSPDSPPGRSTLLITGPNMGGKSTVMRQMALIVILGQTGAPVPAESARWGAFSSVYTRIGAQDAIDQGQSTFMVEMTELAHILHHADSRSLIVLDEIGRGTSTYDGMSVAWSTLEWICTRLKSRTLFATHYHELTRLAQSLPNLANAHMAVETLGNGRDAKLRFLYRLREGATNESFGVHVARMAGLPDPVIERAWEILIDLEKSGASQTHRESGFADRSEQLSFFAPDASTPRVVENPVSEQIRREIESLDLNQLTPIQALNFLEKLRDTARGSETASA